MNKETGGPAFPDPQENWRGEKGMTLRDYLAAKAMQGLLDSGQHGFYEIAPVAYQMADAMLKAREQ